MADNNQQLPLSQSNVLSQAMRNVQQALNDFNQLSRQHGLHYRLPFDQAHLNVFYPLPPPPPPPQVLAGQNELPQGQVPGEQGPHHQGQGAVPQPRNVGGQAHYGHGSQNHAHRGHAPQNQRAWNGPLPFPQRLADGVQRLQVPGIQVPRGPAPGGNQEQVPQRQVIREVQQVPPEDLPQQRAPELGLAEYPLLEPGSPTSSVRSARYMAGGRGHKNKKGRGRGRGKGRGKGSVVNIFMQ